MLINCIILGSGCSTSRCISTWLHICFKVILDSIGSQPFPLLPRLFGGMATERTPTRLVAACAQDVGALEKVLEDVMQSRGTRHLSDILKDFC